MRPSGDLEGLFIVGGIHAEHGNGAGGRNEEGVDEFGEGRFAAAVAAENRDELPLLDGEADAAHGELSAALAVGKFYVVEPNCFHICYLCGTPIVPLLFIIAKAEKINNDFKAPAAIFTFL